MFLHNFKYTLKTLCQNRTLLFWSFAFPLILGTFFNMAFSNIEESETLDIINIALVTEENEQHNQAFIEAIKTLSDPSNEEQLFQTDYVSLQEAQQKLGKKEITGYIIPLDNPKVVVTANGVNETILKYVTEEISQSETMINTIAQQKIQQALSKETTETMEALSKRVYKETLALVEDKTTLTVNTTENNLSYTMIEFYTLIAMACLYGGILGMSTINQNLANMSMNGKRVAISPTSKTTLVTSSVLASFIVQLFGLALLFVYTVFVLNVDYGSHLGLVILLAIVGSLAGLSLGIAVSSLLKTNENTKVGIIISITMLGCFLSGMMGITMKYIIDKNIPLLNQINPANMITDGFYSLYYYTTLDRFFFNLTSLIIFSLVMIGISIIGLRRQKYDSL